MSAPKLAADRASNFFFFDSAPMPSGKKGPGQPRAAEWALVRVKKKDTDVWLGSGSTAGTSADQADFRLGLKQYGGRHVSIAIVSIHFVHSFAIHSYIF